jgi:hypothetical protein
MDANGLRFWLLGDGAHFPALQHTLWDGACRRLRLASERTLPAAFAPAVAFAAAQSALERVPRAIDALGCVAHWDVASSTVRVTSMLPDAVDLLKLAEAPSDLCAAPDGVLYLALAGAVRLHDLRGRWSDVTVSLAGFAAWRLAPAVDGGVWALERSSGRVARLTGRPRRTETPQPDDYDPRVFRPSPENPCAPRLALVAAPALEAAEVPVAIASGPDGAVLVLGWAQGQGVARVRCWLAAERRFAAPLTLQGAAYAYAAAWVAPSSIVVRVPGRRDAPGFDLSVASGATVLPLGDIYPLAADAVEASFANGAAQPPHYPVRSDAAEPLYPLSLRQLARRGEARSFADGS